MKKIKIPNKLKAIISKLDTVVSVGTVLTCVAALIVGSVQFKNSLTDVNSDITMLDTLPYEPSYVTERNVQTHSNEEITAAWKEKYSKYSNDRAFDLTIAQMSFQTSMQPHDPGVLADLIVIGTYTGYKQYCYRSFVADIRIDEVISPLGDTSKLTIGGRKESTYKIPPFSLRKGDLIKVYDELSLRTVHDNVKGITMCPVISNPHTCYLTPLKPNGKYLFFLNYAPKTDIVNTDTARFKIVPSLYTRIAISDRKTFEPNIFCANLPTKETTESSTAKPLGTNSSDVPDEEFDRQWQEAYERVPKFTYHDATKIDLFVESPKVEQLYRNTAAKILQKYL